jgi:uncharacterized protein YggU (UPF0235/DUF167 family)
MAWTVSSIEITPSPEGSRLRLRVRPGARREGIEGERLGALKVSVAAPPERGRANDAVRRLLAASLDVPLSSIEVISGHGSRDKGIVIASLSPDEVRRRLAVHCRTPPIAPEPP